MRSVSHSTTCNDSFQALMIAVTATFVQLSSGNLQLTGLDVVASWLSVKALAEGNSWTIAVCHSFSRETDQ